MFLPNLLILRSYRDETDLNWLRSSKKADPGLHSAASCHNLRLIRPPWIISPFYPSLPLVWRRLKGAKSGLVPTGGRRDDCGRGVSGCGGGSCLAPDLLVVKGLPGISIHALLDIRPNVGSWPRTLNPCRRGTSAWTWPAFLLLFSALALCPWSGAEGDKEQRIRRITKIVKIDKKDEDLCQAWAALLAGNSVLWLLSRHKVYLFASQKSKLCVPLLVPITEDLAWKHWYLFQTSMLLFHKLHKIWMSNLPPQGENPRTKSHKKYRSRQQTIFRWKCAKTTARATFLPQVITPSPSCGDKISKNLNCYNVFLILKCNFFPIPSSFFWLYRSLSDETVAAPWAKQNQGRINAEDIENTDNDQLGEEIEEEQMCGAPECDLR